MSIPDSCVFDYDPVCGCDGHTYFNLCDAQQSQASVSHLGECGVVLPTCGGAAGTPCPSWQYCELPAGQCSSGDAEGLCVDVPLSCTFIDCSPVCGCDGITYANSCETRSRRLQVSYPAPCFTGGGLVTGVHVDAQGQLVWDLVPGAIAYNVYRKEMVRSPPRDSGSCYQANLTVTQATIAGEPGDAPWLFDVSAVFPTGEGPLGTTGWCMDRVPLVRCPAP